MRRVNLSKSTGKIVDTKIDSITQLTVSGDILTADEDEDNEDWLTNFLSTETSSSPGHVGNIRKVKAAHVKGSKTRPATAPVGDKRPLKSAVEVNNNTAQSGVGGDIGNIYIYYIFLISPHPGARRWRPCNRRRVVSDSISGYQHIQQCLVGVWRYHRIHERIVSYPTYPLILCTTT